MMIPNVKENRINHQQGKKNLLEWLRVKRIAKKKVASLIQAEEKARKRKP
jgi:hypothetical protein